MPKVLSDVTGQWLRRAVAAALVVAAPALGVVLPSAPASAAACSGASGVTVVVDPHGLGGGVRAICDGSGGGAKASTLFTRNGFDLTYVQRQPGFVCQIDGAPASDPCVNTPPADAYWGLFWSDGTTGTWSYATAGAAALTIPDGGYVAFSWQGSTAKALPGVTPTAHASTSPSPSPNPSASPSGGHSSGGGTGSGSGSADPTSPPATPSSTPSTTGDSSASPTDDAKPRKHRSKHPGAAVAPTPSPSASADPPVTEAAAEPTAARTGGLPGWVVPALLVLLAGSAAGIAVFRRTRGAPPP